MSQASILLYGRDQRLLDTRRMVLERSGARVWSTTQTADFNQMATNVSIDLIVFCHSLSLEDCGRALALATTRWSQVQSIVLVSGPQGCHSLLPEHIIDTTQGPAYLVQTVTKLLAHESASKNPTQQGESNAYVG